MATPSLQELLTSPPNEGTSFHQDASEKEQGILDAMNQHFGETGYTQPIAEGSTETAELTEREMMFLVSLLLGMRPSAQLMVISPERHSCGKMVCNDRARADQ